MIRLLKKGVELGEKISELALTGEATLVPENKHIIVNSNPEAVGIYWVYDLFEKIQSNKTQLTEGPYFEFNANSSIIIYQDGGCVESVRFHLDVDENSWNLKFYDIISKRKRYELPFSISGGENGYHFSIGNVNIKRLNTYMEKGWKIMGRIKEYDEFDFTFYLQTLELLVEMFPSTDLGIQEIARKFRNRIENYG